MTDIETISDDARTAILNAEIAKYARAGWIVQNVANGQAVLSRNKRIGVFWNLVLTVVTCGLWLIVVIVKIVNRKKRSKVINVDAYGKISSR